MAIKTRGQLARDDSNFPVGFNYFYYTNQTTGNIKTAPGFLHGILTSASVGTLNIYDTAATVGNTIANLSITGTSIINLADLNITAINGLYVTTSGTGNITFIYV